MERARQLHQLRILLCIRSEIDPLDLLAHPRQFLFEFEKLADQSFVEADQQIRGLTKGRKWEDELTGYNEAWDLYEDGVFTFVIAEKLYNSLEAITQKICVDLQDWADEDDSFGTYVETMREKGLFEPNDAMQAEWQKILSGVEQGVNRTGGDRKRHESIDRDLQSYSFTKWRLFLRLSLKGTNRNIARTMVDHFGS
ncbi:MAG: hypothetical protein J07HQW1_02793 [Haloquadratum walsbyi J07HQW1]|uniref:Uncharacterized protein n=1 Tax=Haloquadratum walsbyi J07HQW1 TaxID=1238424 RepID=U1PKL7_9EURY|nr:MAG: hypothetical protein J07HQW1_02793 [Haloquadratum walsbyi J07HQW1]